MAKGDRAKAFIQQVLGKITDPGQRTAAEAVFANPVVVSDLDDGVAGQSEIDRRLQELTTKTTDLDARKTALDEREGTLTTWKDNLTGWRTENVELVELGAQAKKAGWKPGDPPPKATGDGTLPEGVLTEAQFKTAMGETENAFLGFQAVQNELQRAHFKTFGEILDITPLLKHPKLREVGLAEVYKEVHKDALKAKDDETAAAKEKAIRDDERAKTLAANAQTPYPLAGAVSPGSPLDAIGKAAEEGSVVDRATAQFTRLQATRPQ